MRRFRSSSIRVRLTAWYGGVLAITFAAVAALVLLTLRHSVRVTVDRDLRARVAVVRSYVNEKEVGHNLAELRQELKDAGANAGPGYVRVFGPDGGIIYASPSTRGWPLNPRTPTNLSQRGVFGTIDVSSRRIRVLSAPLSVGTVQVGLPLDEFEEIQEGFVWSVVWGAPLLLLFACIGGYWMSGRALRPVDEIASAARRITAGNLSDRLPSVPNGDELDRLSRVLNDMLAGLESAFRKITQFTADASHELRTPLAIIRTTAEVTRARPRTAEEQQNAWKSVLTQTERATQLVNDLLMLARGDSDSASLHFEVVDLTELTRAGASDMRVVAEANGLQLTVSADAKLLVSGDGEALRRTIAILVDNAMKATPAGGRIQISLRSGNAREWVTLAVSDNGCGIPSEDLPHIFDRFYRVSRDRSRESGGAGLGLSIAKWVVTQHGGTIDVESTLGSGATFRMNLPCVAEMRSDSEILQNQRAT